MPDEIHLITEAKIGSAEAFGKLYDAHAPRIYRFILLKTGHKSDTEDLTHEVFLAAWRTIASYRAETSTPFKSWLYRIAANRVIDYYRTAKKHLSLTDILEGGTVPVELVSSAHHTLQNALHHQFEMQTIMNAMQQLTEDQQTILIMRYVEDLSPSEIAHTLGKTSGSVRLIQHRALKQLKSIMEQKIHGNQIPHQTA